MTYKDFIKKKLPILTWFPTYTVPLLLQDILAGFTVGLTEIPQGIAYAVVAGLSPEYGLYSGLMDGFVYAFMGGCKDLNIGPTSIVSLMLQPHVSELGSDVNALITFLSGVIIFAFGVLNLGFVIQFFSYPIVAGFMCAGSLQIACSQLNGFFGISGKANAFLEAWEFFFQHINEVRLWDSILGLVSLAVLIFLREMKSFGTLYYRSDWSQKRNFFGMFLFMISLARNALVVIIGTLIAYYLREDEPFRITGTVTGGFPPFKPPHFTIQHNGTEYTFADIAKSSGPSFIFIPVISILEAISIAKAFSKGKPLDASQEMLALGICNFLGSFVSSMPVTGSFTRSAVNNASGVRTTFAGVFTSILLLLAIAFLTPTFYYVPKATLAAVIICAMLYLFDYKAWTTLWKSKKLDFIPFLSTFFCCLFISIEYGILIGVGVNLLFVLYASARPKFEMTTENNIIRIVPKDTLYYPSAEYLRDTVLACEDASEIVINGRYIRNMDVTVAKSLAVLARELGLRNQKISFVEFKPSIMHICLGVDQKLRDFFIENEDYNENMIKGDNLENIEQV